MVEPIRILHVVGSLGTGGIQSYLMELYRHIDREKVQFDFVANIKAEKNYAEEIGSLGGRVYYIDGDAFEKGKWIEYIRFWKRFFAEDRTHRIVHGHLRSTAAIYLLEAKRTGRYTIAHSHATSNGYGRSARVKDVMQYPVRFMADYCMGCSQQANEWLFGKKRAGGDRCTVIYNGIDIKRFAFDPEKRAEYRKAYGIGGDTFVIGTVGRLVKQKNQPFLLDVMNILRKTEPDARLFIVGDGPEKDTLCAKIESLGLDDAVIMPGSRSDVDGFLSAFDVFVLPSIDEGLGISAIEAQANGLPVEVSPAIPSETLVTDLVERASFSPEEWAEALLRRRSEDRRDRTRELTRAGYSIDQIADRLCGMYQRFYREAAEKTASGQAGPESGS